MASYTAQDLANIKAAIAGGLRQASIQGEMVVYRDLPDMLRIKSMIEADLAGGAAPVPFRTFTPSTSRGV